MRLSFANEASQLITTLGGNLSEVLNGVGLDSRIGQSYLRPSPGWVDLFSKRFERNSKFSKFQFT